MEADCFSFLVQTKLPVGQLVLELSVVNLQSALMKP